MANYQLAKSQTFPKYWLSTLNSLEMQLKKQVCPQNSNLYAYAANNPVRYIDPDGNAYTFKISDNEYCFSADLCVLDKTFDDLMGLIPYSSISKLLSNKTSKLNRIEQITNRDIIRSLGEDSLSSLMEHSDKELLKSIGKFLNTINIAKTVYLSCKDLLDNQTVGRDQFIENEFYDVLKGTSRENVISLYAYAKKYVDYFIDCGYISLEIDKKGILKGSVIHNQTAIDMLYNELKNLQLKLNYGNQNE